LIALLAVADCSAIKESSKRPAISSLAGGRLRAV
jgi:hypothetical protein